MSRLAHVCDHCNQRRATHIIFRHPMIDTGSEEDIFDFSVEDRVCLKCAYYAVRRGEVDEYMPIAS